MRASEVGIGGGMIELMIDRRQLQRALAGAKHCGRKLGENSTSSRAWKRVRASSSPATAVLPPDPSTF